MSVRIEDVDGIHWIGIEATEDYKNRLPQDGFSLFLADNGKEYICQVESQVVPNYAAVGPDVGFVQSTGWYGMAFRRNYLNYPRNWQFNLQKVRILSIEQSVCKRAVYLYELFMGHSQTMLSLVPREKADDNGESVSVDDRQLGIDSWSVWKEFLSANRSRLDFTEAARRLYRDGELIFLLQDESRWGSSAPKIWMLDSEEIWDYKPPHTSDDELSSYYGITMGINCSEDDATEVVSYTRRNTITQQLIAELPANLVLFNKIGSDTTEKRGRCVFQAAMKPIEQFETGMEVEFKARKLQASFIIHKKVQGSPGRVQQVRDNASNGTIQYPEGSMDQQVVRAGTIITTNQGVEYDFKTPQTNWRDASPLMREVLLQVSQATGWPEYMLTMNAGDANLAALMVQENPVFQMINHERGRMTDIWKPVFMYAMRWAMKVGKLKTVDLSQYELACTWPDVQTKDPLKQAQAGNINIMNRTISRAQNARDQQYNSNQMRREVTEESDEDIYQGGVMGMNPGMDAKAASSAANAAAGGTNQGDAAKPGGHSDNTGTGK
jgi:hypothetical protein